MKEKIKLVEEILNYLKSKNITLHDQTKNTDSEKNYILCTVHWTLDILCKYFSKHGTFYF